MKTYDCFIFYNELDLLELRLNMLNDCVDYFVIVESAITFQGATKEFLFEKNRSRFSKFEDKIIHLKVENYTIDFANLPYVSEPKNTDEVILNKIYKFIDECPYFDKKTQFWWGNDFFQRECIWRAIAVADPKIGDLILLSDVDEIPDPSAVVQAKRRITADSLIYFQQHEFCYFLNYYHNSSWIGTCCFVFSEYAVPSLNAIRATAKSSKVSALQIINDSGWHFTSVGNIEAIRNKIRSWSHREFNTAATLSSVEYNVKHGYDIFRRPGFGRLECIPLTSSMLPAYLVNNASKFERLIGPEIEKEPLFQWAYYAAYFYLRSKAAGVLRRLRNIASALQVGRS
jgi:beta-1,4-mannosyl-glycoprotein beta-1,4-N-acetylglucosaminyltransferase